MLQPSLLRTSTLKILIQSQCYAHKAHGVATYASAAETYLPNWMLKLMPGGKKKTANERKESQEDKDIDKGLEKYKDMDIAGYAEMLRSTLTDATPPKPRFPPVRKCHFDYDRFVDARYQEHSRTVQQEKICQHITKEEGIRILDQHLAILKDEALMENIADRTGTYIALEVKDTIRGFFERRDFIAAAMRLNKQGRHLDDQTLVDTMRDIRLMRKQEAHEKKLRKRDPDRCPVKPVLGWAGPDAVCTLTGLHFFQCCGATLKTRSKAFNKRMPLRPGRTTMRDKRFLIWVPRWVRRNPEIRTKFDEIRIEKDEKA